jgi:Kef-type K+ transport system membrane component KefB
MQTNRDRGLIVALVIQAAIQAAAGSALLTELAPRPIVAAVGLISSMLSSSTAVYVAVSRDGVLSTEQPTSSQSLRR